MGKKKKFNKAADEIAARYDLDPLVIREAYKGRENMLIHRKSSIEGSDIGTALSSFGLGMTGVLTSVFTTIEYMDSYSRFDLGDNLAMAAPFAAVSALGIWGGLKGCKSSRAAFNQDLEKFASPEGRKMLEKFGPKGTLKALPPPGSKLT